ncbi:MAG: radical SAM protein [Candidatus Competibacteraceae bacterium]
MITYAIDQETQETSKQRFIKLLKAEGQLQRQLFQEARAIRRSSGLDEVMLRGVIEISNHCQKQCDYCAMRCTQKRIERYRLSRETILDIVAHIKEAKISTVFLQSGQDPHIEPILQDVIPEIKQNLKLNVLLCLGEKKSKEIYQHYKELGADSYILKFETSDSALYQEITYSPLAPRLKCIQWIKEAGLQLGTGNIVGLPNQSFDSLIEDIDLAIKLQPDFVSSAPFMPNNGTPFEHLPYGDLNLTLNTMALWRIALGDCLIPAVSALEKIEPDGQLMGLQAGANVITVNFTPPASRAKYSIYSKDRFVVSLEHALRTIERAGLRVHASSNDKINPQS